MKSLNSHELDSLLFPSQIPLNEERNNSLAVSEFMINKSEKDTIDLSNYTENITINTSEIIKHHQINLEQISKDDLFSILNSRTLKINPQLFFPKLKHINDLFWFLNNLCRKDIDYSKITFSTNNEFSDLSNDLIDAAVFFGFLVYAQESDMIYLIPSTILSKFSDKRTEDQYLFFLEVIGSDKTARDCINIQLNDPIYDRLSKQMVFNKLKENHNVIEEKLSDKDISKIVNNVRYWFLDIKKYLL